MIRHVAQLFLLFIGVMAVQPAAKAGPQPPTGQWRILCLGDSITQGNNTHKSYRHPLNTRLNNEGVPFTFVGSLAVNFGGASTFQHDGHWGWDTEDILNGYICNETICPGISGGRLSQWLNGYFPDIVLIHLGHNDLFRGWDTNRSSNNLNTIINQLRARNPNIIIFLSKLINTTRLNENSINAGIVSLAASKNTSQSPVILVDNYAGFNSSDLQSDGTHPDASGELKMANKFGDAIVEHLNFNTPPTVEAGANQTITWPQLTTTLNGQASDDGEPTPPGFLSVNWVQLAGPTDAVISNPTLATTPVSFQSGGEYFFRLRVSDGEFTLEDYVLITVEDGGNCEGESVLVAGEADGGYLYQAKAYNGYTSGTGNGAGISWGTVTEYHNIIGGSVALQSLPYSAGSVGNATTGARLDYPIFFSSGGTWYVWLRIYGATGHDSVHIGINESAVSLSGNGVSPPAGAFGWTWQGHLANQTTRLAINVPNHGLHRLNVWIHESGTAFDQLLITRDPQYVPGTVAPLTSLTTGCDKDNDALPDSWEIAMFGNTAPPPMADTDGDTSLNVEEYIAGTHANNGADYPQVMTQTDGNGALDVLIPSVAGRLYDIEFTEDLTLAQPQWYVLAIDLAGINGLLSIPHPNAPPRASYRYHVRMAP